MGNADSKAKGGKKGKKSKKSSKEGKESKPNKRIGALLKKVPLLAKLTDTERALLGGKLTLFTYEENEDIVTQGQPGKGFFIISRGTVNVFRYSDDKKEEPKKLATLKAGDFFGETALINSTVRSATITAACKVDCFYLDKDDFDKLFSKDRLNIQFAKRKAVSAEQRGGRGGGGGNFSATAPKDAERQKSPQVRELILTAVRNNVLFMNLDPEHKMKIVDELYRKEYKKGETCITQGELGDNLYVVESGTFDIYVNDKQVATRGAGTCFGELALMYNSPRAATVMAASPCVVWVIDRFAFRRIVTDVSDKKFKLYVQFLKKVNLLSSLAAYEREKIAEALEEVQFSEKETIFEQNDAGDAMYIVYSGEVVVYKSEDGKEAVEVARCKQGDVFGERALLKDEPRAATLKCVTNVKCLKLDRAAFSLLLGPLEDIMNKKVESYDKSDEQKDGGSSSGGEKKKSSNQRSIGFDDLKVLGTLGKGSFGHVQLVQHKKSNETFALKSVSKAQIVATQQQGHIMSEKRVMEQMDHPFLVRLHATYKDRDKLYFLLEPALGGELFSVLREKTLFDEDTARFYAGCVVLAFEYMHEHNIIYRDLKPENLLLDNKGFIKVTDFGFAKDVSGGRTWTLCGTPDYLAPEVVAGKGHGKGVDWWTLGVFIYEMLASYPPFYDEDPMKVYAKIMHGQLAFPSHFSKEAVNLIKKLLHAKPTKRMGVTKGGARNIKKHNWFKGFDWDALYNKTMRAPYVPKIADASDLSNFDEYPEDEDEPVEPYEDDGSNWDQDF